MHCPTVETQNLEHCPSVTATQSPLVQTPAPTDHCYTGSRAPTNPCFSNIKFMSLNLCGLYSKMKYGILESIIKDLDFVCLCETKTKHIPQNEFENFHIFTSFIKSNGLAILANKEKNMFLKLIENTDSDHIIWLGVGGNNTFEFILGSVYIPCEKSLAQSEVLFDEISNDLVNLKNNYDLPFIYG